MSQGIYARSHSVSAGAMLAQAREEAELTVPDVARHLKISPAQVEALEAGAYEKLPGRVFVRGFLRNYAKLLGVDPQPLLRSIEYEIPQPAPVDAPQPSNEVVMSHTERAGWPLYLGIVAVAIFGALAVYEFGFNDRPPSTERGEGAAVDPNSAAVAPSASASAAPASGPLPQEQSPASAKGLTVATAPELVGKGRSALDTGPGSSPLPEKAGKPGERELHFRFEAESWVEIRDRDDKVIFSKLNRAGSEERVAAVPPLKLVVGNARGVRLDYNRQPVDLTPHIGVTVARLTLQ